MDREDAPLARRADEEARPPGAVDDGVPLRGVDAAAVLVEGHQLRHVVGRQGEDHRVLGDVDDGRGLAGDLRRSGEVPHVLGDDDEHPVVFAYPLRQLVHEVQGYRVFLVDEEVRLVDGDHHFPVRVAEGVVVAVPDDLVLEPAE